MTDPADKSSPTSSRHGRRHRQAAAIVFILGAAATLGLFAVASREHALQLQAELRARADAQFRAIEHGIAMHIGAVGDFGLYLEAEQVAHGEIARQQFASVARALVERGEGIRAIEWVPRVGHTQRAAFEAEQRAVGYPFYRISKRAADGPLIPADVRDEYFPVALAEPLEDREPTLGFDWGSEPDQDEALSRARDTGELAASGRIHPIRDQRGQWEFLVAAPVYRRHLPSTTVGDRRAALAGFAVGLFDAGPMIESILKDHTAAEGFDYYFFATRAPRADALIHAHAVSPYLPARPPPWDPAAERRGISGTIAVAGREWTAVAVPPSAPYSFAPGPNEWLALLVGIFGSSLVAGYLLTAARHAARLQRLSDELNRTAAGLALEVEQRRKAEAELSFANAFLRAQMDSLPDGIVVVGPDGRLRSFNRRLVELGEVPEDVLRSGDDARIMRALAEALRDSERFFADFAYFQEHPDAARHDELVFKSGRVFERYTFPLRGADGSYLGRVFFHRDITEKKRAEQALHETLRRIQFRLDVVGLLGRSDALLAGDVERLAREITEVAAGAMGCERVNVWLFNDDETELRCIDGYEATPARHTAGMVLTEHAFRREFAALKDTAYVDADDPLTDPRTAGYVESYIKPLHITSMLDAVVRVSGRTLGLLCFEHVDRPHHWERDEIVFACQLADKIGLALANRTRLQAEEELRASETRFRAIFESVSEGIFLHDMASGAIIEVNPRACEMFGYSREEMLARSIGELSEGRPPYSQSDAVRLVQAATSQPRTFEWRAKAKGGRLFWVEVSLRRTAFGGGEFILASVRDITEKKNAESELRFANIVLSATAESSPDGILVVDAERRLVLSNRRFAEMWRLPPDAARPGANDTVLEAGIQHLRDPERFLDLVTYLYDHPDELGHGEIEFKDGRIFDWHSSILHGPANEYLGRVWFFRDVTAAKAADEALRQSEEKFRTVAVTAQDAIIMIDAEDRVVYWNPGAERTLGYTAGEAAGKFVHQWLAPARFREDAAKGLKAFARTGRGRVLGKTLELAAIRKDGVEIPIELSVAAVALNGKWHAVGVMRDITDRKRAEQEIVRLARNDPLTGLANRNAFVEALQRATAQARREGLGFAVLYLDLDHFKDINDTLGHSFGDLLLKAVGERLASGVRETDTVARFGGDEFAVLQAGVRSPVDAGTLAAKLIDAMAEPFTINGTDIRIGTSIGIDLARPGDKPETLLAHADVALYRAKADGRNTFRFFTEAMDQEVRARVQLERELKEAMASNQFFLEYQPQVRIQTGRIIGVEALVRWRHPKRGVLSSGEFIPAAERAGLIVALGSWVLREACRQAKEWLEAGIEVGRVAVNISPVQFKVQKDLEDQIAAILQEAGLPPRMLEIELTESAIMETTHELGRDLSRLRQAGISIAIDDFGTGYSSLDYLRRFPVDRIKIAQDFVLGLPREPSSIVIVKAALGLARALQIPALAEGVETAEQLALLKAWHCREAQGYYFSRPVPAETIARMIALGGILPAAAARAPRARRALS